MTFRDLGKTIVDLVKPDGSGILKIPGASSISKGAVSVVTGLTAGRAKDVLKGGISSVLSDAGKFNQTNTEPPNIIKNPLENFAHYSPLWTFACITPAQYNNPQSYRNSPKELKHVVFASGGRFDSQRVNTVHGAPEYYVNNFVMETAISGTVKSGNSNAFKFSFDIVEPHSMGLLLQSMQNAAVKAGYNNYLNNCPFVLRLDFMGYDEDGRIITSIKPKFWTVSLTKVTFSVNENGSVYKVEAVPMSHKGFSDITNIAYTDIKIACSDKGPDAGTVKDVLVSGEKSLCAYLNDLENKYFKEGQIKVKDVYVIEFPERSDEFLNSSPIKGTERKASLDPNKPDKITVAGKNVAVSTNFGSNDIGGADFGFDQKSGGNYPFARYGDKVDPKTGIVSRDKMQINPKTRVFQFTQKQSLTAIINQVILNSVYAKKAIDPKNLTRDGFIKWWRIDVQVQLLDLDPLIGEYAQKFIFRVVPYLVHHTIFSPPTAAPIGYDEIKNQICKQYNYIYTGQNLDVLKFDIQINNLFFTGKNTSSEQKSGSVSNQDQKGVATDTVRGAATTQGAAPKAQQATMGRARIKKDPSTLKSIAGGNSDKDTEQKIAEAFHKSFITAGSGDLVNVDLEIMGDPYWLIDSGISNYFSRQSTRSKLLTEDGTMNYEGGNVFVYLTFRTPSDIDETTGLYQYPTGGKESPFSGIYRVTKCDNTFTDGIFKQKLKCVRQPGQSQDYGKQNPNAIGSLAIDKLKSLATSVTKEVKDKSTPSQEYAVNEKGEGLF
jgi:hypothetical protein